MSRRVGRNAAEDGAGVGAPYGPPSITVTFVKPDGDGVDEAEAERGRRRSWVGRAQESNTVPSMPRDDAG